MTTFMDLLLPAETLIWCVNAALAASLVCAIALLCSRRPWPLPVRHALLAVALGLSVGAPLLLAVVHAPTLWSIRVSDLTSETSNARPDPSPDTTPFIASESPPVLVDTHDSSKPATITTPTAAVVSARPVTSEDATITATPVPVVAPAAQATFTWLDWSRSIGTLLCGIWFAGIAVGGVRLLGQLRRLRHWRSSFTLADSPTLLAAARSAAQTAGLRRPVSLWCSDLLPAPITCGVWQPRIVVPSEIEASLTPAQLQAVLLHEMAHIMRRDAWIGLLQLAARMAYWWNPLVRLASRQLDDVREQICDDIALGALPEPRDYAATLLDIADRCTTWTSAPATLSVGSSSPTQLESRVRRILAPTGPRSLRLSRPGAIGVSVVTFLMTATLLLGQVREEPPAVREVAQTQPAESQPAAIKTPETKSPEKNTKTPPAAAADSKPDPAAPNLPLADLMQRIKIYEEAYLPCDLVVMNTFRMNEGLTPKERSRYPWADGRKHQRLMEYAQLAQKVWRKKETMLVDDVVQRSPDATYCDGERRIQVSQDALDRNGGRTREYYISYRQNMIFNFVGAPPQEGVFPLASFGNGQLLSDFYQDDPKAITLAWDHNDARLTIDFNNGNWNSRLVLWLSQQHAWHPVRLQRYLNAADKHWLSEWQVTRFAKQGNLWRVAEGTQSWRDVRQLKQADAKIMYFTDFAVRSEKYGSDVDKQQFQIEIPEGAQVRVEDQPEPEPSLPTKTRELTVRVVDVNDRPVANATVDLRLLNDRRVLDQFKTNAEGIARTTKAPQDRASLSINTPGFRRAGAIASEGVDELTMLLIPETTGEIVDESGNPVAGAWLPRHEAQVSTDGFPSVPDRTFDGSRDDWSDDAGRFTMKGDLPLRRSQLDEPRALIAYSPDLKTMAIRIVRVRELGQPQKLVLQPTRYVHGQCLLEGVTQPLRLSTELQTPQGTSLVRLAARQQVTPAGLLIDYGVRLPPGDYLLHERRTSQCPGFTIAIQVPADTSELELEKTTIAATGSVALIGKPAPKLDLQWRPGEEKTWETLRGKVVVLNFWGSWDSPAQSDMPQLMDIARQFQKQPVAWLVIHVPTVSTFADLDRALARCQEQHWNNRPLPFTTALDRPLAKDGWAGVTSEAFGIANWPTLIVIDQQGRVAGPVSKDKLAEMITKLLKAGGD